MPRLPPRGSAPAPPPPGPPRAFWRRSRCTPFRQPGATHGAPTAVESAHNARPSQGDGCGPSPCDPLGRRLRRFGHCRGSRVHRRRPARGAAARQGGDPTAHSPSPRGPHPVKGPHGISGLKRAYAEQVSNDESMALAIVVPESVNRHMDGIGLRTTKIKVRTTSDPYVKADGYESGYGFGRGDRVTAASA